MSLIRSLFTCVSDRSSQTGRRVSTQRLKFGQPVSQAFGSGPLPAPLRDLLAHIARDGVAVCDLFRRPGNPVQMRKIVKCLAEGRSVDWTDYNFWTVANVAKKFLLAIPDGVFGKAGEAALLGALDVGAGGDSHEQRVRLMHEVIVSQPLAVQQLLALLFGIWFRMIYHTDVNSMSVEAVAKSVAGSMFHSCTDDPRKVERASKVMELLISGFASEHLFGPELIEYFTSTTGTSINRCQLYAYEVSYPADMSRQRAMQLFANILTVESRKRGFHIVGDAISEAQFKTVMRDGVENYRGTALDANPTLITEYASLQPPVNQTLYNANTNAADSANPMGVFGPSDSLSVYSMQSDITGLQRTKPPLSPPLLQQQQSSSMTTSTPPAPHPPSLSTLPMSIGLRRCLSVPPVAVDDDNAEEEKQPSQARCCYSASEGQNHHHQQEQAKQSDEAADADLTNFPQSVLHQRTPSGRFNSVRRRQLQQLARRTRWFMSSTSSSAGDALDMDVDAVGLENDDLGEADVRVGVISSVVLERPLLHSYQSPPSLQHPSQPLSFHQAVDLQPERRPQQQQQHQQQEQQQQQPSSSSPGLLTERRYFLVNKTYGGQNPLA